MALIVRTYTRQSLGEVPLSAEELSTALAAHIEVEDYVFVKRSSGRYSVILSGPSSQYHIEADGTDEELTAFLAPHHRTDVSPASCDVLVALLRRLRPE